MVTLLRLLALGLYQLPGGWKYDGVRRLQLSAVLAVMIVLNAISARYIIQDVLKIGFGTPDADLPALLLLVFLAAVWLVVYQLGITQEAYLEIKSKSAMDPGRSRARSIFLIYAIFTVLFYGLALALLTPR